MIDINELRQSLGAIQPEEVAELLDRLEAAERKAEMLHRLLDAHRKDHAVIQEQNSRLRARIEATERQEPFDADSDVFRSAFEAALKAGNWPMTRQGDGYRSPSTQIAWRIAFSTVNRLKLYLAPGAQPAPSDEYVGWYCAHCERGVDASEVTYHEQHEACGRVITDDKPPKPAPIIPEGWKPIPEKHPTFDLVDLRLADAGNGSSIGEKGRGISYTPEMAETYGSVRMEELDAMHESEDGIDCMFASGWIIVRQGDNPYRVRLFF